MEEPVSLSVLAERQRAAEIVLARFVRAFLGLVQNKEQFLVGLERPRAGEPQTVNDRISRLVAEVSEVQP